jgi:hypothetical protein
MSRNYGNGSIGQCTLLLALMIQGMTPDGHSLVTPWFLHLGSDLEAKGGQTLPHDRAPIGERSTPWNDADDAGTPDEVCVPHESGVHDVLSEHASGSSRLPFTSTVPGAGPARTGSLLPSRSRHPIASATDLCVSLCRLIC